MAVKNQDIRDAAKKSGIKLWQIAEKLGIWDATLSRKLRKELPQEEKEKIIGIIAELAKEAE
jgi:lambda repressor-like predicted transcriptional regulator